MLGGIDERVIRRPEGQPKLQSTTAARLRSRLRRHRRRLVALLGACILTAGLGVIGWRLIWRQPAPNADPFTASVLASVKFPLYYPSQLPTGYRIDPKSVTEPSAGVVVFNLVGPKGQKLYMSEEVRPSRFNLGGFYDTFSQLKEIGVSDGAIAVGYLNHGQETVASRANNQTWILSNTKARIPTEQLIAMLRSIKLAF